MLSVRLTLLARSLEYVCRQCHGHIGSNGIVCKEVAKKILNIPDFNINAPQKTLDQSDRKDAGSLVLVLPGQTEENRLQHAKFHIVADQMLVESDMVIHEERVACLSELPPRRKAQTG
jgi:hypothetical protein